MPSREVWYEELVRDFYQALVEADGFDTIQVRHDVSITGKSGTKHQIDVFWEFNLAGVAYRTAIECRHYKSRIKKSHIAAFHSIVTDLRCTNGIMVTTSGYQSGAATYAEHHGIRLVLVNPMLREIHVTIDAQVPQLKNWRFVLDQTHADEMKARLGLETLPFHVDGTAEEIQFTDAAGTPWRSLADLIKPHLWQAGEHDVEVNGYLPTEHGRVLVRAVGFEVSVVSVPSEFVVDGLSAGRAVLEDLRSSPPKYLLPDGKIASSAGDIGVPGAPQGKGE